MEPMEYLDWLVPTLAALLIAFGTVIGYYMKHIHACMHRMEKKRSETDGKLFDLVRDHDQRISRLEGKSGD